MKKKLNADKALRQPYPGDGGRKMIDMSTTNETTLVARLRNDDLNAAIELWNQVSFKLFPKATHIGGMIHAKKECQEVIDELESGSPSYEDLATEYADILMCVSDSMMRSRVSIGDVVIAMRRKIEVNKNRKWKDNGDGSYSHIK